MKPTRPIDRTAQSGSNANGGADGVGPEPGGILRLWRPPQRQLAMVLASPHSGRDYPAEFVAAARLAPASLRRSEDSFVDEIFTPAASLGAPMLHALFPRAFLDANREPFEFDPEMFAEPLPAYANSRSPRVAAGLGTIARVVGTGEEIYRAKLSLADALGRVERYYRPYHAALEGLVAETVARFGFCILIDCHSMPSAGTSFHNRAGGPAGGRVDIVLGDCHGSACAPIVTDTAESVLRTRGFVVHRNSPYAGGFTTRHYGRPHRGVHALQVEINRALYMDEQSLERRPYLATLARHMTALVRALGALDLATEAPAQSFGSSGSPDSSLATL